MVATEREQYFPISAISYAGVPAIIQAVIDQRQGFNSKEIALAHQHPSHVQTLCQHSSPASVALLLGSWVTVWLCGWTRQAGKRDYVTSVACTQDTSQALAPGQASQQVFVFFFNDLRDGQLSASVRSPSHPRQFGPRASRTEGLCAEFSCPPSLPTHSRIRKSSLLASPRQYGHSLAKRCALVLRSDGFLPVKQHARPEVA